MSIPFEERLSAARLTLYKKFPDIAEDVLDDVIADLKKLGDDDVARQLELDVRKKLRQRDGAGGRVPNPNPVSLGTLVKRYRIDTAGRRGGMGVVCKAFDLKLNRVVAIKQLITEYRTDPVAREQFVREAKQSAPHTIPGIPPVYSLETDEKGAPFLVMAWINGCTLDQVLEPEGEKRHGTFYHRLNVFQKICSPVAYLHKLGEDHRDLKPHNIMVDRVSADVVYVIDRGQGSPSPHVAPGSASDTGPCSSGVSGTPAYMPPELARNRAGKDGKRVDVFQLGAVLLELLTGHPPYRVKNPMGPREDRESLLAAARDHDFADAEERLAAHEVAHPEVVAIARKCMQKRPEDRYADAAEVEAAVSNYRKAVEDRLRDALVTEARRNEQEASNVRRQRMRNQFMTGLGVLTVVSVFFAIAAGVSARDARTKNVQLQKTNGDLTESLGNLEQVTGQALGALGTVVADAQRDLASLPGGQELRKSQLAETREKLKAILATHARQNEPSWARVKAHALLGDVSRYLGEKDDARGAYEAAREVAEGLLARGPDAGAGKKDLRDLYNRLGDLAIESGRPIEARELYERAMAVTPRSPEDIERNTQRRKTYAGFIDDATKLSQKGQFQSAFDRHRQALAGLEQLVEDEPSHAAALALLSNCYFGLGETSGRLSQLTQARQYFQKACAVRHRLVVVTDNSLDHRHMLCVMLCRSGEVALQLSNTAAARADYEQALAVATGMVEQAPAVAAWARDTGLANERLGNLMLQSNKPHEAVKYYGASVAITRQLLRREPNNHNYVRDLSDGLIYLGDAARKSGDVEAAVGHYEDALTERRRLAALLPNQVELQREVLTTTLKLSKIAQAERQYAAAVRWCERALADAPSAELLQRFDKEVRDLRAVLDDCRVKLSAPTK